VIGSAASMVLPAEDGLELVEKLLTGSMLGLLNGAGCQRATESGCTPRALLQSGQVVVLDTRQLLVQRAQRLGQFHGSGRNGAGPLKQSDNPPEAGLNDVPFGPVGAELDLSRTQLGLRFLVIVIVQPEVRQHRP
jgi:hypothetical protein